jgi:hypothetical protein
MAYEDTFRAVKVKGLLRTNILAMGANQALAAAGAVSIVTPTTTLAVTGTGDTAFTLADGVNGQVKVVKLISKGSSGNAVLTPTNFLDGSTITFDTVLDSIVLVFNDTTGEWMVAANSGTTIG